MKKIIVLGLMLISSSLVYSHSLGIGMYIPLGGSLPSFYSDNAEASSFFSPKSAFEVGVIFNPRVNFNIGDGTHTVSLGVDVGWYRDTFKFASSTDVTHEFDTVMTGLNLEWRPLLFQLGVGGGVKFPFLGKYIEGNNKMALSGGAFASRYNNVFIPYIRLYTGINIIFISLSLYVNFDIPYLQMKDGLQGLGVGYKYPGKLGSVDVGVQFGIHLDIFNFGGTKKREVIEYNI
ncbi:hypothetical protein [Brachyspira pilosicoli]|uniref:hypothetical protein n=1 Tax=Brachyspira pilosicoli TaxID=52584 RepID=UPI0018E04B81|nr:hypothetical protein [Brachyspira pilosicoli]